MVFRLLDDDCFFPSAELAEPDGLLAIGGDLSPMRLVMAYANGIFPWYNEGDPILWWSLDPRLVIRPGEMKVSKSLRHTLRSGKFESRIDTVFRSVMQHCAATPREGQSGTWITNDILEAYCKLLRIEAQTTVDIAMRQILPAVSKYCGDLCQRTDLKQRLHVTHSAEMDLITRLSEGIDQLYAACEALKKALAAVPTDSESSTEYYHSVIVPAMNTVRSFADGLEVLTDKSYWPFPTYADILFY